MLEAFKLGHPFFNPLPASGESHQPSTKIFVHVLWVSEGQEQRKRDQGEEIWEAEGPGAVCSKAESITRRPHSGWGPGSAHHVSRRLGHLKPEPEMVANAATAECSLRFAQRCPSSSRSCTATWANKSPPFGFWLHCPHVSLMSHHLLQRELGSPSQPFLVPLS